MSLKLGPHDLLQAQVWKRQWQDWSSPTNLLPPALQAFYLKQIVYSRFQTPRQDFHLGCH
eukprot:scaffold8815_cov62-Cylindrotheca_fusiformis.AAC.2